MQNSLVPFDLSICFVALVIFQASTRVSGTFPLVIKTVATTDELSVDSRMEIIYSDSKGAAAAARNRE